MEQKTPTLYIFIEGGYVHGISATEMMNVNVFDMDNYKSCPENSEYTPEEWQQLIKEKTKSGEILPIF